jgi:hypothetical protein
MNNGLATYQIFHAFEFLDVLVSNVPRELFKKLDSKAQQMMFIGYVKYNMGYQHYNPSGGKLPLPQVWSLMKGHQLVNFT